MPLQWRVVQEGKEFDFVYDNGIEYTVVVYNKLKNLEEDIKNALKKYDSDNIDIINDDSTSEIYLSYHSKNNSFPLGKTIIDYSKYIVKEVDNLFDNLDKLADKYYLGTQGI